MGYNDVFVVEERGDWVWKRELFIVFFVVMVGNVGGMLFFS